MNATTRRRFLAGVAGAAVVGTAGCTIEYNGGATGGGGGGPNLSGVPSSGGVGSGFAYEQPAVTQQDANHTVRTSEGLKTAIEQATSERHITIWIPPDAAIDLTGESTISLENVTLASSRSVNHPGAIIYTETYGEGTAQYDGGGMFDCGANVRITGLRLRGPHSNVYDDPRWPGYIPMPNYDSKARRYEFYDSNASRGLTVSHGSVRIDNCEIFGWSRMGVYVNCPQSYGRDQEQSYPRFNNISGHDCMMTSSGYVFEIIKGHAVIERSFFNATRHAIAGFGHPDSGYTLSECFFGPAQALFPVDQHYMGENNGNASDPSAYKYRYHSGGLHQIMNCSFAATHVIKDANFAGGSKTPHIVIGAIPHKGCIVKGNAFSHASMEEAISQPRTPRGTPGPNGYVNFDISDNTYGVDFGYGYGKG